MAALISGGRCISGLKRDSAGYGLQTGQLVMPIVAGVPAHTGGSFGAVGSFSAQLSARRKRESSR
jgi:hypothetical protein